MDAVIKVRTKLYLTEAKQDVLKKEDWPLVVVDWKLKGSITLGL